jgi:hypothetical protein
LGFCGKCFYTPLDRASSYEEEECAVVFTRIIETRRELSKAEAQIDALSRAAQRREGA